MSLQGCHPANLTEWLFLCFEKKIMIFHVWICVMNPSNHCFFVQKGFPVFVQNPTFLNWIEWINWWVFGLFSESLLGQRNNTEDWGGIKTNLSLAFCRSWLWKSKGNGTWCQQQRNLQMSPLNGLPRSMNALPCPMDQAREELWASCGLQGFVIGCCLLWIQQGTQKTLTSPKKVFGTRETEIFFVLLLQPCAAKPWRNQRTCGICLRDQS